MKNKRKDFHGSVTYAWEGVFSWQMYGSTEAVDESGKEYTEYLVRCQWGTNFENMQPWIVGRRYSEFDRLDSDLKDKFPELASRFKQLAEKSFFNYLDSQVIAQRRVSMEEYVSHIVSTMPTILRSEIMDKFLNISQRIKAIKAQMIKAGNYSQTIPAGGHASFSQGEPGSGSGGSAPASTTTGGGVDLKDITITSEDQAERIRKERKVSPLDDSALGLFEEDTRELWLILCRTGTREVGRRARSRVLVLSLTNQWPALR